MLFHLVTYINSSHLCKECFELNTIVFSVYVNQCLQQKKHALLQEQICSYQFVFVVNILQREILHIKQFFDLEKKGFIEKDLQSFNLNQPRRDQAKRNYCLKTLTWNVNSSQDVGELISNRRAMPLNLAFTLTLSVIWITRGVSKK